MKRSALLFASAPLCAVLLLLCPSPAMAGLTGYESLANWDDLPNSKASATAGMFSSYDRLGGNNDFNNYLYPQGFQTGDVEAVAAEITGPGVITRMWMPHATANAAFKLKVTVDGVVVIDTDTNTYFGGGYGYVNGTLTRTMIGGQYSYEPIVFQSSLKIETNNFGSDGWAKMHNYYQINYQKLPAGTPVVAYTGQLTAQQQSQRQSVAAMLANVGRNPAGASASSTVLTIGGQGIAAGQTLLLGSIAGSGEIRRLNLRMAQGASDADLDGLRLRVRYDGRSDYAIDVPVSQFFGAGHGRVPYQSLPLGTDSPDGFYSYWPMPFRQGATVELYNNTSASVGIGSANVEYDSRHIAGNAGYLHAVFNETATTAGQAYYTMLSASGRGHYVGNLYYLEYPGDKASILEADDIITVNPGKANQSVLYGTGLEDAYNGGYYYNHVLQQNNDGESPDPLSGAGPYSGLLYMEFRNIPGSTHTRTDQYRWMIADYVPFTDGIEVKQENFTLEGGILQGSTAFYYATPALGDANGDGVVDVLDLGILASHWQSSGATWDDGDFNGDGVVDVLDLGILATNWQGSAGSFTAAVQAAGLTIPEPTIAVMLLAMIAPVRRFAKRGPALRQRGRSA